MDVVQTVLAIAPVLYLQTSFTLLASIHKSIQQAKTNKLQLRMLSDLAARLLKVLNDHIQAGKISPSGAPRWWIWKGAEAKPTLGPRCLTCVLGQSVGRNQPFCGKRTEGGFFEGPAH
jgi:hypothetical protein